MSGDGMNLTVMSLFERRIHEKKLRIMIHGYSQTFNLSLPALSHFFTSKTGSMLP